jgi:ubiquinol-cytochrome c reductase cytochrome c subunit
VQVAEAVRTGPGEMPAFGEAALSSHDLDSLTAYVRYLDKPKDRGGQPLWHVGPVAEGAITWLLGMVIILGVCRWIGDRS